MSLRLIDFIISSVRGSNQWKLSHFICQSFTRIVYKAVYLNSILGFLPRKFFFPGCSISQVPRLWASQNPWFAHGIGWIQIRVIEHSQTQPWKMTHRLEDPRLEHGIFPQLCNKLPEVSSSFDWQNATKSPLYHHYITAISPLLGIQLNHVKSHSTTLFGWLNAIKQY